jgi:chemotaxis protein histidine kinase CheA
MDQEIKDNKLVKKNRIESYDIAKSDETMHLAVDLAKFIKENRLFQNIQGREYVNVEGWQYAGSRLGILPVVEEVINMSTDTELKYQAKVNLLNLRTEQVVGAGFAICSNKEQGKKFYQEFAIASMAQTRAIGKAYRNALAWIIRAAGYEPTPAEEMDYAGNTPEAKAEQSHVSPAPAAAKAKEARKAEPAPEALQTPAAETAQPVAETPAAQSIKYASAKQKEEIIRLLNNPVITRPEKTKMLLNINKLDEERAAQVIAKLAKVIEERETQSAAA